MYHFIYPYKDSFVSDENSMIENHNFGGDENLVLRKTFTGKSNVHGEPQIDGVTRILLYFNLSELSQSIVATEIPTDAQYNLRLYEKKTSELAPKYTLTSYMLYESQSMAWTNGTGVMESDPNKQDGVTWEKTDHRFGDNWYMPGMDSIPCTMAQITTPMYWGHPYLDGGGQTDSRSYGGGVWYDEGYFVGNNGFTESLATVSRQGYSYESPDINMDVTRMIHMWLDGTRENYGMVVKWPGRWSGSQEIDPKKSGNMNFYSYEADSIYSPKIEIRYDTSTYTYSGDNIIETDRSKDVNVYMLNLKKIYKEKESPKFRVAARERIQKKVVSTMKSISNVFVLPQDKAWYSITDIMTGEVIVPFDNYSKLSSDSKSSYFKQNLKGFINNRTYKIKFKLQMTDGKYKIFDGGFEFRVVS